VRFFKLSKNLTRRRRLTSRNSLANPTRQPHGRPLLGDVQQPVERLLEHSRNLNSENRDYTHGGGFINSR